MRKIFRAISRIVLIIVSLTAIFSGLLFISGLGGPLVQSRIQKNLVESLPQFISEGSYPKIFDLDNKYNTLDNFTETTILQEAFFMDTVANPKSIFENPRVNAIEGTQTIDKKVSALIAAANGEQPTSSYSYYWMGFRIFIRPLLAFMTYPNIRILCSSVFYLLMAIACVTIYKHTSIMFTISFVIALISVNVSVVASQIQFAICFYLLFTAVIVLPYIKKTSLSYPELFLIIGACTQFFDFYTTPIITLGAPLLFLLSTSLLRNSDSPFTDFAMCALFWFLGYCILWLSRLLLASIVLRSNVFEAAFGKLMIWTGIEFDSRYVNFSVLDSLKLNFRGLINSSNLVIWAVSAVIFVVTHTINRGLNSLQRSRIFSLLIATLPVVWIVVSYKASSNHFWFQYRSLLLFVFGVFSFIISVIEQKSRSPRPNKNCNGR